MSSVVGAVTSKIDKIALGGSSATTPVLGNQGSYSAPGGGMGGYSGGGPDGAYVAPGRTAMQGFGNPNFQDTRSSSSSSSSILQKAGEVGPYSCAIAANFKSRVDDEEEDEHYN